MTNEGATAVSDNPKMVKLPHYGELDLAKLNEAMDAVLEFGSEASGRYALRHTHGWPAPEAVQYAQAAQFCFDSSIDPNEENGWWSVSTDA